VTNTLNTFFRREIPADAPDHYKQAAYEAGRREAGMKLYDLLWREKTPAIVEIEEEIKTERGSENASYYGRSEVITIRVKITPVEHRHIILTHGYHGALTTVAGNGTMAKIKWNLRYYWRRLFA
jgi:hypothetical protein